MLVQPAACLDVGLVHADHEALMQVLVELCPHRVYRGTETMAQVLPAEPAGEVDVRLAVDVGDARAFSTSDGQGRGVHTARDVPAARLHHTIGRGPFRRRHGAILYKDSRFCKWTTCWTFSARRAT